MSLRTCTTEMTFTFHSCTVELKLFVQAEFTIISSLSSEPKLEEFGQLLWY